MSGNGSEAATIETRIPSRLDRLPWSRFHWMVVIGLTVWILDPTPRSTSFREIARTAFERYPAGPSSDSPCSSARHTTPSPLTSAPCWASSSTSAPARSPLYIALFAASDFLGPLTLSRLFDTVGRKPMVSFTYLGSALITTALGIFLLGNDLTTWSFMAFIVAIFFLASAGASSAYLTVSEIFPRRRGRSRSPSSTRSAPPPGGSPDRCSSAT